MKVKLEKALNQRLVATGIFNSIILTSAWFCGSAMALGVPVTSISTSIATGTSTTSNIAGSGSPFYSSSTTYTLNYAAQTESITGGTTAGSTFSTIGAIPLTFVLNRNTGTGTTTGSEIVWSKETSRSGNIRNLKSGAPTTEVAALGGNNINLGTDNLFTNTGDGNGNNNNVERADFLNTTGFAASPSLVFPVFERGNTGGHDKFKIAAITSVSAGAPSGYGSLITVNPADYSDVGSGFVSVVQRNGNPSADTAVSQILGGVLIRSSTDLSITAGTTIFGFSLFSDDVPDNADLVNFNSFPIATTTGGIDLIAANIGAVNLVPVPFEFNPQSGLLILGGALLVRRMLKKSAKTSD